MYVKLYTKIDCSDMYTLLVNIVCKLASTYVMIL